MPPSPRVVDRAHATLAEEAAQPVRTEARSELAGDRGALEQLGAARDGLVQRVSGLRCAREHELELAAQLAVAGALGVEQRPTRGIAEIDRPIEHSLDALPSLGRHGLTSPRRPASMTG